MSTEFHRRKFLAASTASLAALAVSGSGQAQQGAAVTKAICT